MNSEIQGAIQQVEFAPGQFLSNLFLMDKKDLSHRPVISLKYLNSFISYQQFRMGRIHFI